MEKLTLGQVKTMVWVAVLDETDMRIYHWERKLQNSTIPLLILKWRTMWKAWNTFQKYEYLNQKIKIQLMFSSKVGTWMDLQILFHAMN